MTVRFAAPLYPGGRHCTKSVGYRAILRRHVMAIEAKAGEAQARHLAARHITADMAPLAQRGGRNDQNE